MSANPTRYRIFISSPGDVREERDALEEIIKRDLQMTLGRHLNLFLEPLRWETNARPTIGEIQANLFEQFGEYDIFVGIFWKRFGTPTSEFESGSEAEFRDALRRWEADRSRPILMYFCQRPFMPRAEDLEQYAKVLRFREELGDKGLYWTYDHVEEFSKLVRQHLYAAILDLSKSREVDSTIEYDKSAPTVSHTAQSRQRYLRALRRECLQIPLTVMGEEVSSQRAVTLDQVYISLRVTQNDPEMLKQPDYWDSLANEESFSALDAIQDHDQVVLLGDPGSGKSSFVKHLIANIAESELDDTGLLGPTDRGLLPVLIVLRDLAPSLSKSNLPKGPSKRRVILANLVADHANSFAETLQVPEFSSGIRQAFVDEKVFLVLDGLDEVPYDLRSLVREAVGAVLNQFNLPRIIITCRIRSYVGASVFNGVKTFTLAKLSEEQIRVFIEDWYQAQSALQRLAEQQRESRTKDLVEVASKEPLLSLARNPMLLTTMTIIHQQDTVLPKERVKLYAKAVDILLRRWQQDKGEISRDLALFMENKEERIRPTMERLAFEAHKIGAQDEVASLPRMQMIGLLSDPLYLGHESLASQFLDYIDLRSGLLIGRGGTIERPATYSFPHRTFQEYLAGCYIVGARGAATRLRQLAAEGELWGEAISRGVEEQVYNSGSYGQNHVLNLASQLSQGLPKSEVESRVVLWVGKMSQVIGVETVLHDPGDIESGEELLSRLQSQFISLLDGFLPPLERAEAGSVLATLGDPRQELSTLSMMPFCYVPSGAFLMGSEFQEINISYDYWIGKFPVTQIQFQSFIDNNGYNDRNWWTEDGWEYIKSKNIERPASYGYPFDLPNHPIVGLSWFEAHAYTNWLTYFSKEQGWLSAEEKFVLPNEPEWEKAARGGMRVLKTAISCPLNNLSLKKDPSLKTNDDPNRIYPWGKNISKDNSNFRETSFNATSTPGCFPLGVSPYGIHDLSGNIWEWTRSCWDNSPYPEEIMGWAKRETLRAA